MTLYIIKDRYENKIIGIYTDKELYENALQYFIQCEFEEDIICFKGTFEELDIEY